MDKPLNQFSNFNTPVNANPNRRYNGSGNAQDDASTTPKPVGQEYEAIDPQTVLDNLTQGSLGAQNDLVFNRIAASLTGLPSEEAISRLEQQLQVEFRGRLSPEARTRVLESILERFLPEPTISG